MTVMTVSTKILKAPFPYCGCKSRVAAEVWARFGDPVNSVEPFFGSGAALLGRPGKPRTETVNDLDGMICNFWRAVKGDPDAVTRHADYPIIETDLHARHRWLVGKKKSLVPALDADPDFFDVKIAGWWVWGASAWIGPKWCVERERPKRQKPRISAMRGINATTNHIPYLSEGGCGVHGFSAVERSIGGWMRALSDRLRRVRVVCGDWSRVTTPAVTTGIGETAVFLDPPYASRERKSVYSEESFDVAHDVREWCKPRGDKMRIALCGYDDEHNGLEALGWDVLAWKANGGYGVQRKDGSNDNCRKERIWFSPRCLRSGLFG
jgi:hypothetical protein